MKILLINYEYPPLGGGGGVATRQYAEEWVRQGHQVDVITSHFRNLPKHEIANGVNVYRVLTLGRSNQVTATLISMGSYTISCLIKSINLCRGNKYDVINTYFAIPSGPLGIIVSFLFGIRHVLTIIGGDIYDPSKKTSPHRHYLLRKLVTWVINKSGKVVAISNDTKERAYQYYNISKDIDVINLGFTKPDIAYNMRTREKKELGLLDNYFYLISIGRLVERKGYKYLIQAITRLDKYIKLLLIGEGPERASLEYLVNELSVSEQVKFLGYIKERRKFQYLLNSDLYVLSSLHEGFGIVLQEAMFCGLPIVATNNGGQTDLLVDGENALLVKPGDSKALGEAIDKLVRDADLRTKFAEKNREKIRDYYIQNPARDYLDIFRNH